jgi:hypothetical protein
MTPIVKAKACDEKLAVDATQFSHVINGAEAESFARFSGFESTVPRLGVGGERPEQDGDSEDNSPRFAKISPRALGHLEPQGGHQAAEPAACRLFMRGEPDPSAMSRLASGFASCSAVIREICSRATNPGIRSRPICPWPSGP